jgi:DNA repair protein RAD16
MLLPSSCCCCCCWCCRTLVLRKDRFDASEADFYEALYTQSRASFGAYVTAGTLLNNYAHIFDLLIR